MPFHLYQVQVSKHNFSFFPHHLISYQLKISGLQLTGFNLRPQKASRAPTRMRVGVEITEVVGAEDAAIAARRGADVQVEFQARFHAEQTLRALTALEQFRRLTLENLTHVLQQHVTERARGEHFCMTIIESGALAVEKVAAETLRA